VNQNELRAYLDEFIETLPITDREFLAARLESLISVFPFNEYEYILMFLRDRSVLTFQDYEELRSRYVSANRYLDLFGLAPRIFGQVWGEQHLMDLDKRFVKPDKAVDSDFKGQYDLWIEGVRVEVKAARAIDTKKRGNLVSKALRSDSERPRYWVLSHADVRNNPYLSHQHRGGVEYQIGITDENLRDFDRYLVDAPKIGNRIIEIGCHR